MLKVNFPVFELHPKTITGGHLYDRNLIDTVRSIPEIEVTEEELGCHRPIPKVVKPIVEFCKGIKKCKGDILIFNSSKCLRFFHILLWYKLFSRKKIHTIHHLFIYPDFKGLKKSVYKFTETIFLKLSDKIIVPSPYIYKRLTEFIDENKLILWQIPFEMKQEFVPAPIPGNLTFAGTIEPRKGVKFLFEALNLLKQKGISFSLNVMGKIVDRDYFNDLKEYSEKYNLNVNFLGFLSPKERNKVLAGSDIFVFPSLHEGFGMVLVEAQVYGLPIVSFDNSSMPLNVIDNINGYAVSTGDVEAFAEKIGAIVTNRQLREKLSLGAIDNLKNQWSQKRFEKEVTDYFADYNKNL